jgi:hypothetical protein
MIHKEDDYMMQMSRTSKTWTILLFTLMAIALLAACSGGDQMLLAEFNRSGEAEIFLAKVGAEEKEWQSLADNVQRASLFSGEFAAFVPGTNRIIIWYADGNDLRVEQMKVGDDAPTEVLDANADASVFGYFEADPFAIYLTETQDFDTYRCYVSLDGAEAQRLARSNRCVANENGVVLVEYDRDTTTVTLVSLDGEKETVILDEVEDVAGNVRFNEDLTTFVYMEIGRRDVQLFLIQPGDEEGEEIGDEFAFIDTYGFLPDGKTIYVIGKPDEDDDEEGLYINGTGDALLEALDISLVGLSKDGDHAVFFTENENEMAAFVYSIKDETVTEVVEEEVVSMKGFIDEDRFLLKTQNGADEVLLSVSSDGSEVIELLDTDDYDILSAYLNVAAKQLLVQLGDQEGTDTLFVTSWGEEDGYFLLEEWYAITLMNASDESLIFAGREDERDDIALFSIPWEPDASETELDDDGAFGYRNVFFTENGRSIYYTVLEDGLQDTEVRLAPVDGSENPEGLYKDYLLLDVNWHGEPNLQFIR